MTVAELIAKLQTMDPSAQVAVVTPRYEEWDSPTSVDYIDAREVAESHLVPGVWVGVQ